MVVVRVWLLYVYGCRMCKLCMVVVHVWLLYMCGCCMSMVVVCVWLLQENLRAMQARDKALEKRRSQLELRQEQQILSAEGNASEIMMRDNLLKEHAQKAA